MYTRNNHTFAVIILPQHVTQLLQRNILKIDMLLNHFLDIVYFFIVCCLDMILSFNFISIYYLQ